MAKSHNRSRPRDGGRRSRSNNNKVVLIAGLAGGAFFVLMVAVAAVAYFVLVPKPKDPPAIVGPGRVDPADWGRPGLPNPLNLDPKPKPPAPPTVWKYVPAPGPTVSDKVDTADASTTLTGVDPECIFPTSLSKYALLRTGNAGDRVWSLFDLETFQTVKTVKGKLDTPIGDQVRLSADGKYIGWLTRQNRGEGAIQVYSFADEKLLEPVRFHEADAGFPTAVDFLSDGLAFALTSKAGRYHFVVCDFMRGEARKPFPVAGNASNLNQFTFSPDRRYLMTHSEKNLFFYEAATGELVGEMPIESGPSFTQVLGTAISPDGATLAVLIRKYPNYAISQWGLHNGSFKGTITIEHDLDGLLPRQAGIDGPPLAWAPDGNGWFYQGQLLLDVQTGAPVHAEPYPQDAFLNLSRRMMRGDRLVTIKRTVSSYTVVRSNLPMGKIAEAVQAARAAGKAPAETEARTGDLAKARKVPSATAPAPWVAKPDGVPASGPLPAVAIALDCPPADVKALLFAAPSAAVGLAIIEKPIDALAATKTIQAIRFNLKDGKAMAPLALGKGSRTGPTPQGEVNLKASLSPDGRALLVHKSQAPKRLDLWDLEQNAHRVGWQLADDVDSLALLGPDRALTLGGGKLTLWKLPECEAVYVADGCRGRLAVSPGGAHALVFHGTAAELRDTATGERLGTLENPPDKLVDVRQAAFRSDGLELVAAANGFTSAMLVRWDVRTGKLLGVCSGHRQDAPILVTKSHALQGSVLYDWTFNGAVWDHFVTVTGHGSPDGRLWYVARDGPKGGRILPRAVPDPDATAFLDQLHRGDVKPIVPPGTPVRIQLVYPAERGKEAVEQQLSNQILRQGLKVGEGGLTMSVSAKLRTTGMKVDYEISEVNGFRKQLVKVPEQFVDCSFRVEDARGDLIAKNEYSIGLPASSDLGFSKDYVGAITAKMWTNADAWCRNLAVPTNVFMVDGRPQALPLHRPIDR